MTHNHAQANKKAVHITEAHDAERQFVLHPESDDLFVRTGKQVIEGCHLNIGILAWIAEFNLMLEYVQKWAQKIDNLQACVTAPRGARNVLYLIPMGDCFDFQLADKMVALELEITSRFNIGYLELLQIPWEEQDRFFDAEIAREIYVKNRESHQAVDS